MCIRDSARTAREIMHAIFAYFLGKFFDILKPFPTENEKTEATLKKGIDKTEFFHFIIFFRFRYGSPSKWPPIFFFSLFFHFFGLWWPKYET